MAINEAMSKGVWNEMYVRYANEGNFFNEEEWEEEKVNFVTEASLEIFGQILADTYYEVVHDVVWLGNGVEVWSRRKIRRFLYGDTTRSFHWEDTENPPNFSTDVNFTLRRCVSLCSKSSSHWENYVQLARLACLFSNW